jgi:hypothetical protein
MNSINLLEIVQWLAADNVKNQVAALSASSIFIAYLVTFAMTRKAAFIVAFLCVEIYGNTFISESLTDVNYYLGYALIYCMLYFYLNKTKTKTTTLLSIALVILLDVGSAIDAAIYPQTKTAFYSYYEYSYVFVHLCVICSLVNWKLFRTIVGQATNSIFDFFGISYCAAYFLYNSRKIFKQT